MGCDRKREPTFHPGETTLVTFRNPFSNPWDGETAKVPAYVRLFGIRTSTPYSRSTARISGARCGGFRSRSLFMCPCHGGVYYADGSRASGPPERGLFTYEMKVENGKLMINAGQIAHVEKSGEYERLALRLLRIQSPATCFED